MHTKTFTLCKVDMNRVRRFRRNVLSETVFAHIFPVSNENENERRTLYMHKYILKGT